MALDGTSDVAKKRKSDEINQDEETIAAAKLLKVEDQNGSGGTTQSSTEDSDSQHSSSDESTSASQAAGPNPAAPPEVQILIPPAVNVQAQPEQDSWVLELREGTVFASLLSAFSADRRPDEITYEGQGYNLTAAFQEFWATFYSSSEYSTGDSVKLPNERSLTDEQLLAIARILKRGWQDDHYFPQKLLQPFIEACIFSGGKLNSSQLTANMFLQYIESTDRQIIEKDGKSQVFQEMLAVFNKYCPEVIMTEGYDLNNACVIAMHVILLRHLKVIKIWNLELSDLLKLKEFEFLSKPSHINYDTVHENDMLHYVAPHKLWHTFFYGWDQDKIDYYFRMLANEVFPFECSLCGSRCNNAKHFLCCCDYTVGTVRRDRHDAVLRIIERELKLSVQNGSRYFSTEKSWKLIVMYNNERYPFPEELDKLEGLKKYPHLIAFSTFPTKRALVVEPKISWEFWLDQNKVDKENEFIKVTNTLKELGFEVNFEALLFGSRGVVTGDIYNFFKKYFEMPHSNISRAMEEISKKILSVPYKDYNV